MSFAAAIKILDAAPRSTGCRSCKETGEYFYLGDVVRCDDCHGTGSVLTDRWGHRRPWPEPETRA